MESTQRYTLSQLGSTLGDENVEVNGNQVDPQRETAVITFECPRRFEMVEYVGSRDNTRFVPRTMETTDGTAGDDTEVQLETNIQPVAGEEDLDDQDYPAVVAYNVAQGAEVDVENIDYDGNVVTLASDPADGETVKLYPIMSDGTVQYRLVNQFGQEEGRVYPWATPIHRWHDFPQLKQGREINLHGSASFSENERLELLADAPQEIVWEDPDYPRGEFVTTFEQDVTITL
jgi:hypothetical protein